MEKMLRLKRSTTTIIDIASATIIFNFALPFSMVSTNNTMETSTWLSLLFFCH